MKLPLAQPVATVGPRAGILLVFSVLAVSAMEYFYMSQNYILIAFALVTLYFFGSGKRINRSFFLTAALFLVIETFQYLMFGGFNLRTFSGTYVRLFLAFAVVTAVKEKFLVYYVKLLYFLSVISLVFYAGSFLPGAQGLYLNTLSKLVPNLWTPEEGFYKQLPNIVIFTFEQTLFSDHRNSGPFWEPGAFAVFLMIALLFNQPFEPKLKQRRNLVFIICLITTFSTAGYIVFFVFLISHNFALIRKNVLYILLVIAVLIGGLYAYRNVTFLQEKVEQNITLAGVTTTSRFGSALADLERIGKSPLVGLGRAGAKEGFITRSNFTVEQHRNNGVTDLMATYGIIIALVYFQRIYLVFKWMNKRRFVSAIFPIAGFIIIFLLGFSQGLFLKPFFYCFLFLPFAIRTLPQGRLIATVKKVPAGA